MKNNSIYRKGEYKGRVILPKGVNEKEKAMFLAFAKSVNASLGKV